MRDERRRTLKIELLSQCIAMEAETEFRNYQPIKTCVGRERCEH